ncbi:zinc-ribbon domain-containing protein [Clostridium sp. C2-6-12]|uniref:zinc-ribbon domain-containing protein n=1 Tax=Clostridium sp. C2-6-12 TaxID=2698832 RepID=UPI00136F6408|nr:zinc-ribbon domain-containing protein [Clostridium sp. C2-6-12]
MKNIDYKYSVNQIIIMQGKKLKILEKIRKKNSLNSNLKAYKYKCLECNNIDIILENQLNRGTGCNFCCTNPRKIIKGLNDISTTHPNLSKYFVYIKDSYKISKGSHKNVLLKCPECGYTKEMQEYNLVNKGFSCPICSDGISFPNKLMFIVLKKLEIGFENEYSPEWIKPKRYDFFINEMNLII